MLWHSLHGRVLYTKYFSVSLRINSALALSAQQSKSGGEMVDAPPKCVGLVLFDSDVGNGVP